MGSPRRRQSTSRRWIPSDSHKLKLSTKSRRRRDASAAFFVRRNGRREEANAEHPTSNFRFCGTKKEQTLNSESFREQAAQRPTLNVQRSTRVRPALAGLPSSLKLRRDRTARQASNLPAMLRTAMQTGAEVGMRRAKQNRIRLKPENT